MWFIPLNHAQTVCRRAPISAAYSAAERFIVLFLSSLYRRSSIMIVNQLLTFYETFYKIVNTMTPQEKQIIKYYKTPHSLRSTGERFGLSGESVRQLLIRLNINRHSVGVTSRSGDTSRFPQKNLAGVYVIQGEITRLIKIGVSTNIRERLYGLQGDSPDKLNVIHIFVNEGHLVEQQLHKQFKRNRAHGEWFTSDILPELKALMKNHIVEPTRGTSGDSAE